MSEWHRTETYKSLVTIGMELLKLLAAVNGGAAIAVLTYLGNLAAKTNPPVNLPAIQPALFFYCAGLFLIVLAFILAYLTQFILFNESDYVKRAPHEYFLYAAMTSVLLSALAFGLGCWKAATALTSFA